MAATTVTVPTMTCRHGVRAVTAGLRDLAGVEIVEADPETGALVVHGEVREQEVRAALVASGFPAEPGPAFSP